MQLLNRFLIIMMIVFIHSSCHGQSASGENNKGSKMQDTIYLLKPDLQKGMPLMQTLNNRHSVRSFSDKKLSLQQISELLWSANGINRDDGKRTAPAAVNVQFVDIYVVMQEGVYLYDALKHRLIPVVQGDFRKDCGSQDFVAVAALNLVYVADFQKSNELPAFAANASREMKLQWAYIGAGAQSQNANLYCASEGIGAVVRTSINGETFGKIIHVRTDQTVVLAQTIGIIK